MEWALALVALALLGVAAVSQRLAGTPVTPAILFVAFGLLVGPKVLDGIDLPSTGSTVRTLAEATLALVLFADASRIDLAALRRTVDVPLRLLGIGLPLTILLGAVAAAAVFGELSVEEAVILAVVLAPTDAALGQAVVTEPRVPQRIRQGLNVDPRSDARLPRLVRPARRGVDRVRGHRHRGVPVAARAPDRSRDLPHRRALGPRPRADRRPARRPLRPLVRAPPA